MKPPVLSKQKPWIPWSAILPTGVILPLSGITHRVLQDEPFAILFGEYSEEVSIIARIKLMIVYASAAAETSCVLQRIINCK
jgi:hypothetical protein